jgi:hypothetical protein
MNPQLNGIAMFFANVLLIGREQSTLTPAAKENVSNLLRKKSTSPPQL